MKTFFKKIVGKILFWRAKKVLSRTEKVIGITGSVGKTSTRAAIAAVLGKKFRVQTSPQNFNTPIGLLLSILNIEESGTGLFSWIKIVFKVFNNPLPEPEILILEFGIDAPGDMAKLLKICAPFLAVLTPIALAHAADGQFENLEKIRAEKLRLARAARQIIANDFDTETAKILRKCCAGKTKFFGENAADILEIQKVKTEKNGISFLASGDRYLVPVFGKFQAQIFAPAILLGLENGLSPNQIQTQLSRFLPPVGRGRIFPAKNGGTIWDFSYNSSPAAAAAVLKSLPEIGGFSRKIAILGTMNELGKFAKIEHEKLGKLAAEKADEILFVGKFADDFARGVAKKKPLFCFENAILAGNFLKKKIAENDFLLFKGSQNSVFLEESIKIILKNPADAKKLCRQNKKWRATKKRILKK